MIGVDLVDVARLGRALARTPSLLHRTFTPDELVLAPAEPAARATFLAGRFAVKEAVLKALRIGLSAGHDLREIETLRDAVGAPLTTLHGGLAQRARTGGWDGADVTISHDHGMAVGVALLRRGT